METIGDGFQGQLFAKFISEFPVTTARTSIQSNLNVAISLTDCPDRRESPPKARASVNNLDFT